MKTEQKQNVEKEYWPIDDSMAESIESLPKSYRPTRREFEELIYEIKDCLEKRLIEAGHSEDDVRKCMFVEGGNEYDNVIDVYIVPEVISLMSMSGCGVDGILIDGFVDSYYDELDDAIRNRNL